ncbi:MAG TPA: ECF transporter S component [Firmicutes bacterium]|nr:ECF transporter S component [Candidatus Fermentithermobacillaceae bacterium]
MSRKTILIVSTAILAAMSLVLEVYVHFPVLPAAPYLLYSPGDLPTIVASVVFGPLSGIACAFINATLFAALTGQGGPWGALMHFIASGGMVAVIGWLDRKTAKTSLALVAGILTRTALMIPMNLLVTPIYTGLPVSAVAKMIVPVVIPFNLIHAGINSVLAYPLLKVLPREVIAKFRLKTA